MGGPSVVKKLKRSAAQKPITIKEIARRAGVSVGTVSRGLRDDPAISAETRKKVKALAAKLSFTPSRWGAALSSGRTRCVLFVVPYDPSAIPQSNLLYIQVLEGAAEKLASVGYSIEVVLERSLKSRNQSVLEAITSARVDGAIVVCMNVDDALSKVKSFPVPVVVVNQVFKSKTVDFVVADDRQGAFRATEYLIKAGHTEIAHIGGPLQYYGSRERRAGYEEALAAYGIPFEPKRTRETLYTMEHGFQAAESLLKSGVGFSAVFSSGDIITAGVIASLRQHHLRVPEDVSIASFDDEVLAATITPPLTTVRKPRHGMGTAAATMLLDRINLHPDAEGKIEVLKTVLIERQSIAPRTGVTAPKSPAKSKVEAR